jgi:hypothetical protein
MKAGAWMVAIVLSGCGGAAVGALGAPDTGAVDVAPEATVDANCRIYWRAAQPLRSFDACAVPGHVTMLAGAALGSARVALPFPFRFYQRTFTEAFVGATGTLSFSPLTELYSGGVTRLPNAGLPDTIFGFWEVLVQRTGVCMATFEGVSERSFGVEWNDAFFRDEPMPHSHLSFEVVLHAGTGIVDIFFLEMEGDFRAQGATATVGLQRDTGTLFDEVNALTAGNIHSGSGWRWTPDACWSGP